MLLLHRTQSGDESRHLSHTNTRGQCCDVFACGCHALIEGQEGRGVRFGGRWLLHGGDEGVRLGLEGRERAVESGAEARVGHCCHLCSSDQSYPLGAGVEMAPVAPGWSGGGLGEKGAMEDISWLGTRLARSGGFEVLGDLACKLATHPTPRCRGADPRQIDP